MSSLQNTSGLLLLLPWDLHHPGGVNQVVINLFNQARQSNRWRPIIFVNAWEFRRPKYRELDGRSTISFRLRAPWINKGPWHGLIAALIALPSTLITVRKMLVMNRIRVVNIHYPGLSALNFVILRMLGVFKGKLLLSFHGLDIEHAHESTGLERWMWRALLRSADAIVTCSFALKQRVVHFEPTCEHAIEVIHNGLDTEFLHAQRDNEFIMDVLVAGRPYILNVATFEHKKGQDVLLEAFHLIAGDFPDLVLVLIGRAGPTLAGLKERAQKYELDKRVFFYEDMPHSRVSAFFEHAKVFCLPSRVEPFGIVILEAGIFKLPVVASQVGGVPEIITNGIHGHLVPPDDLSALVEKLRSFLFDTKNAAAYGNRLYHRVVSHFTWKRAFREYEHLIGDG